jgi:putative addiction module killer protein
MYDIVHYLDADGKDHYQEWFDTLKDRQAQVAIIQRLSRLTLGLFGDRKLVRNGIHELRIDVGGGYRLYYALVGKTLVLLTCGGTKKTQSPDIELAINFLHDWKARHGRNAPLP